MQAAYITLFMSIVEIGQWDFPMVKQICVTRGVYLGQSFSSSIHSLREGYVIIDVDLGDEYCSDYETWRCVCINWVNDNCIMTDGKDAYNVRLGPDWTLSLVTWNIIGSIPPDYIRQLSDNTYFNKVCINQKLIRCEVAFPA